MSVPDQPNPRVRIDEEGTDLDEAVNLFEAAYNGASWTASRSEQEFSYRQTAVGDQDMTLRTNQFYGHASGEMAPIEDYTVLWFLSGTGTFDTAQGNQQILPGEPLMFPTDRPMSFRVRDVNQKLVHFHKPFLERIAEEHHGAPLGMLHLDTTKTPDPSTVRSWRNTLALVSRTTTDPEASPILQAEMSRIAAIALLGMFPPTSVDMPSTLLLPGNARLRVAVEYIHANSHLPLTSTLIADASDLSLRALQEGFQRLLDVTPNTYLRNARLDRVRDELRTGTSRSVTEIARAWGFAHPGRFAAAYAARFGEHPSSTR